MDDKDRLRQLLDAVLDEDHRTLDEMADGAFVSAYHFSRQLSSAAGESPVAMRRRVMLERAAWQLGQGISVTDAAFAAGYESVEGFSRAFTRSYGQPPSAERRPGRSHWLPAPNGIHFHSPTALWVDSAEAGRAPGQPVTALMVHHDLDDTRLLLETSKGVDGLDRVLVEGSDPLGWDGPDETLGQVLRHQVVTKEVWLASIDGVDAPSEPGSTDPAELLDRHDQLAPRWLAMIRDVERRGAWEDRLVDALCDPPESFVLSSVIAHVLTFSAYRRELARLMLRRLGVVPMINTTVIDGDPINWLRRRQGDLG